MYQLTINPSLQLLQGEKWRVFIKTINCCNKYSFFIPILPHICYRCFIKHNVLCVFPGQVCLLSDQTQVGETVTVILIVTLALFLIMLLFFG